MNSPTKVLVTGGSGLLGNNVLRQLEAQGFSTLSLSRQADSNPAFENLATRVLHGDLLDNESIDQAVRQADVVVHAAAHIHIGWTQRDFAMQVNEQGTRRIVQACLRHQTPLCYVSTVNALSVGQRNQPSNEDTPGNGQIQSTYVVSKQAAETVVRDAINQQGLKATIVYPGLMFGPWDWKPSSGQMIIELSRRWSPMSPAGGNSICDARDVAAAIVRIIQQCIFGERFVLAGRNMTFYELWCDLSDRLGKRRPLTILRRPGQFVVGTFCDRFRSSAKHESVMNSAAIKMGSQFHFYDSTRAQHTLGYQTRPYEETLDDAISWLKSRKQI